MGVEVAKLHLRRAPAQAATADAPARKLRAITTNGLIGVSLWFLLWGGYNTDITRVQNPYFPTDTMDLFHGVRAFFPAVAAWLAILLIFSRVRRLFPWLMGPMGLMVFYAAIGLISSAFISTDPTFALYYGVNYMAVVLALLAICLVENPLPDLLLVLRFTWGVGTMLTLALLGAIPLVGQQIIIPTEGNLASMRAYGGGSGTIMGMATTRNTGFARYAAMSGLAVLPVVFKKTNHIVLRVFCGAIFVASVYALIIANGRTETGAFIVGLFIIVMAEKERRLLYFLAGAAVAILLGLRGFYSGFFLYYTRTGHVDLTFTGRTDIWAAGWELLWKGPWLGFGFQADRIYLYGWHMHNAFLHALIQSGLMGGLPIILAVGIACYYTAKYFYIDTPADKSLIPAEIPALLVFTVVSSVTESTFAYYSAAWLLSAPIIAYVTVLHTHMKRSKWKAARQRVAQARLDKRKARDRRRALMLPPSEL